MPITCKTMIQISKAASVATTCLNWRSWTTQAALKITHSSWKRVLRAHSIQLQWNLKRVNFPIVFPLKSRIRGLKVWSTRKLTFSNTYTKWSSFKTVTWHQITWRTIASYRRFQKRSSIRVTHPRTAATNQVTVLQQIQLEMAKTSQKCSIAAYRTLQSKVLCSMIR